MLPKPLFAAFAPSISLSVLGIVAAACGGSGFLIVDQLVLAGRDG